MRIRLAAAGLLLTLLLPTRFLFAQSDEDEALAKSISKKFKDDDYAATTMVQHFKFEKGKDKDKRPVIIVKETGSVEFISLKMSAAFQFSRFHNRFIKLEAFNRSNKGPKKYYLAARGGTDRSVTDDNIFFDDSRVQFFPIRFSHLGRMTKIEWETTYTDAKYLTREFFGEYFPVMEKVLEFEVPDWLDASFIEKNFGAFRVDKLKTPSGSGTLYTFRVRQMPALKSEYRDIGAAYTDPHVIIQLKSFDDGGKKQRLFQNTDDLYAWYVQLYRQCKNEPDQLRQKVSAITADKKTDEEKAKAIFYWVQDNIRYIAYEDGFAGYVPATAQEVLSVKYGDCKGMANLLTEMMKLAGLQAHFTWIGTRHIPYDHTVPAMCVDNHAIATLYLGGKKYFLDATEKYAPFGEYAYRIQGKSALIEKGDHFEEEKVPAGLASANRVKTTATLQLTGASLRGKVDVEFSGEERKDFHASFHNMPRHTQQEFLENLIEFGNNNLVASNVTTSDLNNRETTVKITGDIDLSNNVNAIGNSQYVGIDFFPKNLTAYMPDEKRTRGYDFEDVFSYEDEIELVLPPGKKCIDLPDAISIDSPGYAFSGKYEVNGNRVRLHKILTISNSMVPASGLTEWKSFLEQIREFNSYLLTITQ